MEKESVVQHFLKIKSTNPRFFPCIMNVSVRKKCEQEDAMGRFLNREMKHFRKSFIRKFM